MKPLNQGVNKQSESKYVSVSSIYIGELVVSTHTEINRAPPIINDLIRYQK